MEFQRGINMCGTERLAGDQPRKKSQRHTRPAAPFATRISGLWRPGDRVRWRDRVGVEVIGLTRVAPRLLDVAAAGAARAPSI